MLHYAGHGSLNEDKVNPALALEMEIDQAIEYGGFGKAQLFYIAASATTFFFELLHLITDGILLPTFKCEWDLSHAQASIFLFSIRISTFIGGFVGGKLGDTVGRRKCILMGFSFQILMTLCSVLSHNVVVFTMFHSLNRVAFGVLMPSALTIALEVCPQSKRFLVKMVFGIAGTMGALCGSGFVAQYFAVLGWRDVLLRVSLTCFIPMFAFYILPPSARFLLVQNKVTAAKDVIDRIYDLNGVEKKEFVLKSNPEIVEQRGSYAELFKHGLGPQSRKISFVMAMKGLFITTLHISLPYIMMSRNPSQPGPASQAGNAQADSSCYKIHAKAYNQIAMAILPDLLIHPSMLLIAQHYGRRPAITIAFTLASVFLLLSATVSSSLLFSLSIGVGLGSVQAGRSVTVLFASELYPTTLRSVANGMIWSADCLASLIVPVITEYVMMEHSDVFIVLAALAMGASAVVMSSVRSETLGKALKDSVQSGSDKMTV